jgi:UDP-N-acetylglucosamine--N-acetylmuramyl-(pentapeptide) pyrophosphoryl-undecaprenol N-acetylglucosamine transferase
MSRPILIAAGGTGGHLFPARALAAALVARGRQVELATDRRGTDYESAFGGIPVHRLPAGTQGSLAGMARLALGVLAAWRVIARIKPVAAIGFGGYPSIPATLAAELAGVPTALHEQNAILGRANAWLVRRAKLVACGLPLEGREAIVVGNPVRPEVLALAGRPYPMLEAGPIRIVVLGGSQGARTLGRMVPVAFGLLPDELRKRLRVSQQARPVDVDQARRVYAESSIRAEVSPFFGDAPARLAECHLAITRAGASTLAELGVLGRPAILVPYPHAMDDHQAANARAHAANGAADIIPEANLTPERLAASISAMLGDAVGLAARARAARANGRPDAAERLADLVEALADHATAPATGALRSAAT